MTEIRIRHGKLMSNIFYSYISVFSMLIKDSRYLFWVLNCDVSRPIFYGKRHHFNRRNGMTYTF